jgi:hypothetical protein
MSGSNAYQLKKAQDEIDKAENELRDLNKRIGDLQPPLAVINSLKARIDFLNANLDTPASSWVDFLFTLESAVPERVSVKDFNPKDFSAQGGQFTLEARRSPSTTCSSSSGACRVRGGSGRMSIWSRRPTRSWKTG